MHARWSTLEDATQATFVSSARSYVEHGRCSASEWLGTDQVYYPARAGYSAFLLLLRFSPRDLDDLSPAIWKAWAPAIVDARIMVDGADSDDKRTLLELANLYASRGAT